MRQKGFTHPAPPRLLRRVRGLQLAQDDGLLLQQARTLLVGAQHGLHRRRVVGHHLLLHVQDGDARRDRQLARSDVLEQRGLALQAQREERVGKGRTGGGEDGCRRAGGRVNGGT
jgi:hypothetical protein